jgi:hypothetical protein
MCVKVPESEVITKANAWIEPDFSVVEHPLRVLDQNERKTRRHIAKIYKIQWSHHIEEEATWEVRTMCGSRTGGWSLPCVMSD